MSGFGQLLRPGNRRLIKRHALICGALIAAAAAAYGVLHWQRDQAQQHLKQNSAVLEAAQAELGQLQEGQRELDLNLGRYQALEKQGFIGNGDRIAWAETLLRLQRELALPEISFELVAQKSLTQVAVDPSLIGLDDAPKPSFGPLAHDMHILSQGMHESELLKLIEALRAAQVGFFRVNHCSMLRVPGQLGLAVECVLRWVTFAPAPKDAVPEESL